MRDNVIVVGGGPAGSACALALARRGVDVTVVERQRFPRRKVCGEYLNGGAVAALDALGVGEAVRRIARPLRGIRLVPPGTDAIELPFPTVALACERSLLDDMLLQSARAAGATMLRGHVEDLTFESDRVSGAVVRDEAGDRRTLTARFVVGADGSGSLVARKLGLALAPRGVRRFAVGGHYEGFGELDRHVEMYVGTGAYFAINPLDETRSNVMVVVRDRDLAAWSGAVDDGMRGKAAGLGRGHRSFAGARRLGAPVSVGPLAFDVAAVTRAGALLVGDAAGFLNPFTGQGVFLALRGAHDAAAAIGAALEGRARETESIGDYAQRRTSDFRIRRRLTKLVDLLVDVPFLARRASERLRARPEIGATLLGALAGTIPPERGLSPALVGSLLV
jgi:flavin-dependent dehydrogenase